MTSQVSRTFQRHNIKYLFTGFRPHHTLIPRLQFTQAPSYLTHLSGHVTSPLRNGTQQRAFRTATSHSFASTHKMASATTTVPEGTNNWSTPGPAAFDFRSDVVTTPTPSMLQSITRTTLLDDVFSEDPTTNDLESYISNLTAKPASLLVLSGTMGNQLAIRAHLGGPPHSILCDSRSHILIWEAGGAASLSGALVNGIVPRNGKFLTVEDLEEHVEISDDVHACPTRLISLENTLNGGILPLEECKRIKAWRDNLHTSTGQYIPLHCDGARLWEAVSSICPSTSQEDLTSTLREYTACFDTLSLCFSKGLGAPIGSILVGPEKFIKKSRHLRKAIGGGLRQAGVIAAPAKIAVQETFLTGRLAESHKRAKQIQEIWEGEFGQKVAQDVETNMVWLGLRGDIAGHSKDVVIRIALEEGLRISGGRLVVHYQIGDEGVKRLRRVMERLVKADVEPRKVNGGDGVGEEKFEKMDIHTE